MSQTTETETLIRHEDKQKTELNRKLNLWPGKQLFKNKNNCIIRHRSLVNEITSCQLLTFCKVCCLVVKLCPTLSRSYGL